MEKIYVTVEKEFINACTEELQHSFAITVAAYHLIRVLLYLFISCLIPFLQCQ